MKRCEDCIHKNVCLHKANVLSDTYAYMGVSYDTEKCEHYKTTADVVPKSEVEAFEREVRLLTENTITAKYPHCVLCSNGAILTESLEEYRQTDWRYIDRACKGDF